MEIFASHIGEGVDLCYQKTLVSRTPWEISSGDDSEVQCRARKSKLLAENQDGREAKDRKETKVE